jgi:hypothetical protein
MIDGGDPSESTFGAKMRISRLIEISTMEMGSMSLSKGQVLDPKQPVYRMHVGLESADEANYVKQKPEWNSRWMKTSE